MWQRFTILPHIHPFIHRRRCQPRKATASSPGADGGYGGCLAQGHLSFTSTIFANTGSRDEPATTEQMLPNMQRGIGQCVMLVHRECVLFSEWEGVRGSERKLSRWKGQQWSCPIWQRSCQSGNVWLSVIQLPIWTGRSRQTGNCKSRHFLGVHLQPFLKPLDVYIMIKWQQFTVKFCCCWYFSFS